MSKRNHDQIAAGDDLTFESVNADLLKTGKFSDLTITCHGRVFKVHKNIVCPQSKPLFAMVTGGFSEASTGVIDLVEEEPDTVERLLEYLYTKNYLDGTEELEKSDVSSNPYITLTIVTRSQLINTKVYISAEKWDIPQLKNLAVQKFEVRLATHGIYNSFTESLRLVFAQTPESDRLLKDPALAFVAANYKKLLETKHFGALMTEGGDLAFEILKAVAEWKPELKSCDRYGCKGGTEFIAPLTLVSMNFCKTVLQTLRSPIYTGTNTVFDSPLDPNLTWAQPRTRIDLSIVHEKLNNKRYKIAASFERDVRLVFANSRYVRSGNPIHQMRRDMEKLFEAEWAKKGDHITHAWHCGLCGKIIHPNNEPFY